MRRDKKPIGRWIGEAVLIFLSVFGAFHFDNIKDDRAQEELYIRHLRDFKSDLEENQGKFNYELNKNFNPENGQGYILGSIQQLQHIDSLMSIPTRSSGDSLINLINDNAIVGLTPWIFISPQYEKLNSQFYSVIKNDTLKARIQMHYRNNQSRISRKGDINQHVKEFYAIEDELNLRVGGTPANRNILFSNRSINKIGRLIDSYYSLRSMTQSNKGSDSLLLIQVNEELKLWGEDEN